MSRRPVGYWNFIAYIAYDDCSTENRIWGAAPYGAPTGPRKDHDRGEIEVRRDEPLPGIANGVAAVNEAFRNRPHLADEAQGFIRMDVISTKGCPEEIRLITFWTDEESYRAWHRSHVYHESHAGIPKGLKLVPGSVAIEFFEYITS